MPPIEQIEMDRHRAQLAGDVKALVDKYRAIFDWDAPDVDQGAADRLIFAEIRTALDAVENEIAPNP
ncbi:hypothetical protein [Methylocella sp.]|uniref:hypothetical protein n=1 Tax=Methylocella sp. TaxID=1978226 RepID=UPI0035B1D269